MDSLAPRIIVGTIFCLLVLGIVYQCSQPGPIASDVCIVDKETIQVTIRDLDYIASYHEFNPGDKGAPWGKVDSIKEENGKWLVTFSNTIIGTTDTVEVDLCEK